MKAIITKSLFMLIILSCTISYNLSAQISDAKSTIHLIAKSTNSGIVLRWAPDRPLAWYLSLQAGYKIERMELPSAKSSIADGRFEEVVAVLKPWPLDAWQPISPPTTQDQNVAVAAQMIYGKNYKAQNDKKASFVEKGDELKNRYSYNLLAADLSIPAANASGLRWEDKNIKPSHVYIYRVSSLAKSTLFTISEGTTIVHEKVRSKVPIPVISHISQGDRVVQIRWDKAIHQPEFSAYYIERSDDGKVFSRLNKTPYLSDEFKQDSFSKEYFVYQDSTVSNYKNYHYRIVGITPFAEYSATSEPLMQYSIDKTPPPPPIQVKAAQIGPDKIKIEWNHGGASDMKGYYVGHSFDPTSDYNILHLEPIPPSQKYYIHDSVNTLKANHYIIAAVDTAGNTSYSLNTYGHLIDSIPPSIPTGLKGRIDSNGHVYLTWNANKELDIMGYSIHFSNDSSHVFGVATNKPVLTNSFVDTIMVKSLTERIYYKIVAIDKNWNYSDLSPYITLQRPDFIAPSAPIFRDYKRENNAITLSWYNSTSVDVINHILMRREAKSEWTEINIQKNIKGTASSYADNGVVQGIEYEYKILAQDDAGNYSNSAFNYKIKTIEKLIEAEIENFEIKKDGKKAFLSWTTNSQDKSLFIIYKSLNNGPFVAIDQSKKTSYIDTLIKENEQISYRIRVKNSDGLMSNYSIPKSL